jgi:hypothetical protein
MDWIERDDGGTYTSKRHALAIKERVGKGRTLCGRELAGRTGLGSPIMVDCGSCVRVLRADGWRV